MFRTRMLARLLVSALGAIAYQTLVAGEPAASTPPAQSIRDWMTNPSPTEAASPAATPPAKSIREWMTTPSPTPSASPAATPTAQARVGGAPLGTTPPARSIREWMTTPSPTLGPCPTASPIANLSATPGANPSTSAAGSAAVPTRPITISLKSTLRQGKLVVLLDDVPIFNEKFQKPLLLISQTTTWDPLQVAPGAHKLSATVYGTKKTYFSKTYDLQLSLTKKAALRFVMQGDKLTVELES